MKSLIIFFILLISFAGCSTSKNQLFEKNSARLYSCNNGVQEEVAYRIKPHDRLSIIFFDYPELSSIGKNSSKNDSGLEVSSSGTILLPLLGTVFVKGSTKEQLVKLLYKKYSTYLEKPALKVDILDQKVFVLGEVKNPGAFPLVTQNVLTPIKVIAQSGGFSDFARRDVIKIIRGSKENYKIFNLNITDMNSVMKNNITLLPDDIIYVAHSKMKDFNLPLNGMNSSLSLLNTLFSTVTMYKALQ